MQWLLPKFLSLYFSASELEVPEVAGILWTCHYGDKIWELSHMIRDNSYAALCQKVILSYVSRKTLALQMLPRAMATDP